MSPNLSVQSKPAAADLESIYSNWSDRLNHLETTRHGVLALAFAATGYLLKDVAATGAVFFRSQYHALAWLFITFGFFYALAALSKNLFVKVLLAAEQMMVLEYRLGLVALPAGYYSGRVSRKKKQGRREFRFLGYLPEVIAQGYFISIALLCLARGHAFRAAAAATVCGAAFAVHAFYTKKAIDAAIRHKDVRERGERKRMAAVRLTDESRTAHPR